MPFNGSGVFVRLRNWVNDAAANIRIRADYHDSEDDNFASGLSQCITKDGQTTVTANLPMATFKHTNVGQATTGTEYARFDQVQGNASEYCGTSSGTNTITATVPFSGTFNTAGQKVSFKAGGTNTGAATFNGVIIQKLGAALVAGDITANDIVELEHDGTNCQMLSPARRPVLGIQVIQGSAIENGAIDNNRVSKFLISGQSAVTAVSTDYILIGDTSDSDNLKKALISDISPPAATTSAAGIVRLADAAAMEAGTADRAVTADIAHRSPSAAKAWVLYNGVTTTAILASYNISGIVDDGTGVTTVQINTDFSSAQYCAVGMAQRPSTVDAFVICPQGGAAATPLAGSIQLLSAIASTGAYADSPWNSVAFFGDQA